MTVLLIERAFEVRFPDLDRPDMDIKADVHTIRVLFRFGVGTAATEAAALIGARALSPTFPGEIDAPLWHLGREYCFSLAPLCGSCPADRFCRKVGVPEHRTR